MVAYEKLKEVDERHCFDAPKLFCEPFNLVFVDVLAYVLLETALSPLVLNWV